MSEKKIQGTDLFSPFRVLDLTNWRGWLCGKIFADLGADVIKVEPPGGDPGRRKWPFTKDDSDPEMSLFWLSLNLNKRGITLNLESSDGREIYGKLVKQADFVLESFSPGYLGRLGIGYEATEEMNPRVIFVSISPFGQTGPYHWLHASDLVVTAMGGVLFQMGDPDRPPISVSFPQAYFHASLEAAVGAFVAHHHRQRTGEGQHVDASAQASLLSLQLSTLPYAQMGEAVIKRSGGRSRWRTAEGIGPQVIYPCKDGFVAFGIFSGKLGAGSMKGLLKWMDEEGLAPAFMKERDWENFTLEAAALEEVDAFARVFAEFFKKHTKSELYEGLLKRGIMGYPVCSVEDICSDPQLIARDYWMKAAPQGLGPTITYPGPFARFSETPMAFRRNAPSVGEHNAEVYGELGISREELTMYRQAGVI